MCGGSYTNTNKCSHLNSNKHNKYVNQIKNIQFKMKGISF